MHYDRTAMKNECRQILRTARPRVWTVTLVYLLLAGLVPAVLGWLLPGPVLPLELVKAGQDLLYPDHQELVNRLLWVMGRTLAIGAAVGVLAALYQALMSFGYCGYALKARQGQGLFGDLFSGFRVFPQAVGGTILVGVFLFLWGLLILLADMGALWCIQRFLGEQTLLAGGLTALVNVAALAVFLRVYYRYSLTPYYIVTRREPGVLESILAGRKAMKGNVGKRFVLDLSFLGWGLLAGLLCAGVFLVGLVAVTLMNAGVFQELADMGPYLLRIDPFESLQIQFRMLAPVMTQLGLVALLALLISAPLIIWLTGYRALALASFYLTVTGEPDPDELASGEPEPAPWPAPGEPAQPQLPPWPAPGEPVPSAWPQEAQPPAEGPAAPASGDPPGFNIYPPAEGPAGGRE